MATLATIRQAVRDRINEEYAGFFTDTKLNRIINRNYLSVAEEIAKRSDMYWTTDTITTTANTYLYSLTKSPIGSPENIKVMDEDGYYLHEVNINMVDTSETSASADYYAWVGNKIALFPVPSVSSKTYTVVLHALPSELSTDASVLSLPYGQSAIDYLIACIVAECRYIEGDKDMYAVSRSMKKEARFELFYLIDGTKRITVDRGDYRYEDNDQ